MRYLFLLLLITWISGFLPAQASLQFEAKSWEEAKMMASELNRPIFIDAYASWCGPCKMMDRQVFTSKKIKDYFEREFVNLKLDMEQGKGRELSRTWRIRAYPTLLFASANGEILSSTIGYQNVDQLLRLGRSALQLYEAGDRTMAQRFADGERDPAFLRKYARILTATRDPRAEEVTSVYLQTQNNWKTPENRTFVFRTVETVGSPAYTFLIEQREAFEKQFGTAEVLDRLQSIIVRSTFTSDKEPKVALDQMRDLYLQAYPVRGAELASLFKMNYYLYIKEYTEYARASISHYQQYSPDNALELNNAAWTFVEHIEAADLLKSALEWAQESVEWDQQYYNMDTLAWLYFKLGKRKKARKTAEQALQIASDCQENSASTLRLLRLLE